MATVIALAVFGGICLGAALMLGYLAYRMHALDTPPRLHIDAKERTDPYVVHGGAQRQARAGVHRRRPHGPPPYKIIPYTPWPPPPPIAETEEEQ